MKSVGKQLEEARLAKSWTPELAARETKIKVERLRDLELDDYSNFSSPAYARGFVRTYARALGIDEYKILRQLDNKLPEDDNASFANDSGLPYVPEPSQTMHVSSANRTGLYIVSGLGLAVVAVIALVLFEAYRIGELPRYFANGSAADNSTNAAPAVPPIVDAEAPAHAIPVDPNDTTHSPRALPVDLGTAAAAPATTNAAPAGTNGAPVVAAAVPATTNGAPAIAAVAATNAAPSTSAAPATNAVTDAINPVTVPSAGTTNAPTAVPPGSPTVATTNAAPVAPLTNAAPAVADVPPPPKPEFHPSSTARTSNETVSLETKVPPRALPVDPSELAAADAAPVALPVVAPPTQVDLSPATTTADNAPAPVALPVVPSTNQRLVLTASHDSFVRVTLLEGPGGQGVLYSSVLREGQSLSFDGHKFSVNVAIPSAIDITLDGVNYGPHSEGQSPETFTLESHQP